MSLLLCSVSMSLFIPFSESTPMSDLYLIILPQVFCLSFPYCHCPLSVFKHFDLLRSSNLCLFLGVPYSCTARDHRFSTEVLGLFLNGTHRIVPLGLMHVNFSLCPLPWNEPTQSRPVGSDYCRWCCVKRAVVLTLAIFTVQFPWLLPNHRNKAHVFPAAIQ